ncbi:hypothetical protein [Clostridium pasteurianum]|uniref:hypothetical protein n=1 Tax=Clostridium pasteurianum TaxID=1501 RepID=UPI001FA88C2A|nr:hypothetical protein [Clostridium pasteurianum]
MDDSTLTLGDEGVVITEKLSKLINKKVGDNFKINIEGKVVEGKISSITEQYIQHYIYISPSYYKKLLVKI